jgi:DNA-binding transcriptional MocR family regulator
VCVCRGAFFWGGGGGGGPSARLAFSYVSRGEIAEGIGRLAALVTDAVPA